MSPIKFPFTFPHYVFKESKRENSIVLSNFSLLFSSIFFFLSYFPKHPNLGKSLPLVFFYRSIFQFPNIPKSPTFFSLTNNKVWVVHKNHYIKKEDNQPLLNKF